MEDMSKTIIGLVFVAILVLGGFYMVSQQVGKQPIYVNSQPPVREVSVSGEASEKVAPNLAVVTLSIETKESTAKDSQTRNAELTSQVKDALISKGVKESEMETVYYNLQVVTKCDYKCPSNKPECLSYERECNEITDGYKTVHTITVRTEKVDSAGELLDAAVNAGATRVDSVSFTLKDETRKDLETRLLAKAGEDATNKAEKIASSVGAKAGKVSAISESVSYPVYYGKSYYGPMAAEAMAPSQVFGGQIEVTASVSAIFDLE